MDFQQKKKEAVKKEFGRINKWDETAGLSTEQMRRESAERLIGTTAKKNKALQKGLNSFSFDKVSLFDVAAGEPVQELEPAKKAKCRGRQQRQMSHKAQESIRQLAAENGTPSELLQERVDGNSFQIHKGIADALAEQERLAEPYRDMEGSPDFEVLKRFASMDEQFAEAYSSGEYEKRKKYLWWMTDGLMKQNLTAECFTPDFLASSGGIVYTVIMRFKAFETVYNDPINKPYFDSLSEAERKLIKIRILDMAKLYEDTFRLQCRSCGIRMEDGQYLWDDALLAPTEEEKTAQSSFKEKIEQRNRLTREALIEGFEAERQRGESALEPLQEERLESIEHGEEQELKGLGLTGFLVGYTPDTLQEIRKVFSENQENYEANKPLLDLMEQEFFHVLDASTDYIRKSKALDEFKSNMGEKGHETVTDKQFGKMLVMEFEYNGMIQAVFTNRLNALRDAMKAVARGRDTNDSQIKKVLREFTQKLQTKDTALLQQIDTAAASWADRRLEQVEDEQWKAHERYTGQENLAEYIQYLTGFDKHMYTQQLEDRIGLGRRLSERVAAGEIKPVEHFVQTSRGEISGLNISRMSGNMQILTVTGNMTPQQAETTLVKLATGEAGEGATLEKDRAVEEGLREYKGALYVHLKNLETKYGKLLTQLHPEDVLRRIDIHETAMEMQLMQDMVNLTDNNATGVQLFDDNNPMDVKYKALANYFFNAFSVIAAYVQTHQMAPELAESNAEILLDQMEKARSFEDGIEAGPSLKSGQLPYYTQSVRARYGGDADSLRNQGYGRW